ncbi:MAG: hypothetical protein ACI8WT_002878 [Clostridium sp.]|jgi:hypothetical protein
MKKIKKSKGFGALIMALAIVVTLPTIANAHCDTMGGPTVADGKKAMETNNVNFALKWVLSEYEKEISQIFEQSMKVKGLSTESKEQVALSGKSMQYNIYFKTIDKHFKVNIISPTKGQFITDI